MRGPSFFLESKHLEEEGGKIRVPKNPSSASTYKYKYTKEGLLGKFCNGKLREEAVRICICSCSKSFVCVFVSVFFYQISWKADERNEVSIRDSGANLEVNIFANMG